MNKKTKNIVVTVIIVVLVICLVFTLREKTSEKALNFNMPVNNSRMRERNNRFTIRKKDNKTTQDAETKKDEDTEETTNDAGKDCNCREKMQSRGNDYNRELNVRTTKVVDDTLITTLIAIESFLLGGSVMYLILNNINNEVKE